MNIKIVFAGLSVIFMLTAYFPYIKDAVTRKTRPHAFTWLIWGITQATATAGLWYGGGGLGAINLTISTCLVFFVFFLALSNKRKDITQSDMVVLGSALSAILIWWLLDSPLFAVLLVSGIDLIGYIPTFRKSYTHPWAETAFSWGGFAIANIFSIFALDNFNFLTLSYIASITFANAALLIFLLIRRIQLKEKTTSKVPSPPLSNLPS